MERKDNADWSVKPGFHYPSWWPELMGDWFQLPVNTGRVDGRTFPLAELMGPSTSASGKWKCEPINTARVDG